MLAIVAVAGGLRRHESAAAGATPSLISVTVDGPESITVGDHLDYRVEIAHDPGTQLVFPSGAQLGDLDIVGGGDTSTVLEGDRLVTTLTYELAAFQTGELFAGPLPVTVLDATGTPAGDFAVEPTPVLVVSTLGASQEVFDLREIRSQFEPPPATPVETTPFVYAGIAVAALALAGIAAFLLRRWLAKPSLGPPPLSPEDQAAADLASLSQTGLLAGNYRENYGKLSRAVRTYLASAYGFPALACSTREVEAEMLMRGLDRWQARLVTGLLRECDDVVFAGYEPAPGRAESDLSLAYQVIEMAERPALEAAAAPATGT